MQNLRETRAMSSKKVPAVIDLYKSYLASKEELSCSGSKRELLIALSEGVSAYSQNEASSTAFLNILQDLGPKSAGEDCYTEFIAVYLKFNNLDPKYARRIANVSTRSSIHQILDFLLPCARQAHINHSETEMKSVLQDCKNPRNAETCLHTVIIACMILNIGNARMSDLGVTCCCEILAEIQRLNRKAFVKYFRSYLVWYFDECILIRGLDNLPRLLFRNYFMVSPNLVNAECYHDMVTTAIRTTMEIVALKRTLIKSQQIELYIERILELVPLLFAIKIISGPFYTSKTSRIRISAIHFMEIVIAGAYQIENNSISDIKVETPQSLSYRKAIFRAISEMNNNIAIHEINSDNKIAKEKINGDVQSIRLQCQVCLTDAGIVICMLFNVSRIL